MKGSPAVIENLQELLAAEYNLNLQSRMNFISLKFMGVPKIAGKFKKFADQAHDFYQILTARLLVLGATPSVDAGTIEEQDTVTGLLQDALSDENALRELGIAGIQTAVKASDEATAEKLRHIEERHEKHIAWLEQQLALIEGLGEKMYIAEKL